METICISIIAYVHVDSDLHASLWCSSVHGHEVRCDAVHSHHLMVGLTGSLVSGRDMRGCSSRSLRFVSSFAEIMVLKHIGNNNTCRKKKE